MQNSWILYIYMFFCFCLISFVCLLSLHVWNNPIWPPPSDVIICKLDDWIYSHHKLWFVPSIFLKHSLTLFTTISKIQLFQRSCFYTHLQCPVRWFSSYSVLFLDVIWVQQVKTTLTLIYGVNIQVSDLHGELSPHKTFIEAERRVINAAVINVYQAVRGPARGFYGPGHKRFVRPRPHVTWNISSISSSFVSRALLWSVV